MKKTNAGYFKIRVRKGTPACICVQVKTLYNSATGLMWWMIAQVLSAAIPDTTTNSFDIILTQHCDYFNANESIFLEILLNFFLPLL